MRAPCVVLVTAISAVSACGKKHDAAAVVAPVIKLPASEVAPPTPVDAIEAASGSMTATIDGNSNLLLNLGGSTRGSAEFRAVSVVIAPGAVTGAGTLAISENESLAVPEMAAALGVNTVKSVSPAVGIDGDGIQITGAINLKLPLAPLAGQLAVIGVVDQGAGLVAAKRVVVIPSSQLTVTADSVQIAATQFGVYQALDADQAPTVASAESPVVPAKKGAARGNAFLIADDSGLPACDAATKSQLYYLTSSQQFEVCDGSAWGVVSIAGPAGAAGAAGPAGAAGAAGPAGPAGPAGAQGAGGGGTLRETNLVRAAYPRTTFEPDGTRYVALNLEASGDALFYTVDGSDPTLASPIYSDRIAMPSLFTIKTLTVYPGNLSHRRNLGTGAFWRHVEHWTGGGGATFSGAQSAAVDSAGNIYIGENDGCRIFKFAANGTFVTKFGACGSGDGQVTNMLGMAFDASDNLWVADFGNNRVQKLNSSTGAMLTQFGTAGSGDAQFQGPRDIAIDTAGKIYVTDTGNALIKKFEPAGTFIKSFAASGVQDYLTFYDGKLYNNNGGTIVVFDTDGNVVTRYDGLPFHTRGRPGANGTWFATTPGSYDLVHYDLAALGFADTLGFARIGSDNFGRCSDFVLDKSGSIICPIHDEGSAWRFKLETF